MDVRFGVRMVLPGIALCVAAAPAELPKLQEIKLVPCSGHYCVETRTDAAQTVRLGIDLGSPVSYLSITAVKRLHLHTEPFRNVRGEPMGDVLRTGPVHLVAGDVDLGVDRFYVLNPRSQSSTAIISRDPFVLKEDGGIAADRFAKKAGGD